MRGSGWCEWAYSLSAGKSFLLMIFLPKSWKCIRISSPTRKEHYKVGDIFELDPAEIPETTLATCSFPCVDLSLAGNMNGIVNGNHSSAFWGFINVLKHRANSAPPIIMVENVPGWLHSNNGKDFRMTVQALNKLGYFCDVFVLDALRFTAQSRLRVFLIGSKFVDTETSPDLILNCPKSLVSQQLKKSIAANQDLRWFYNELPEPPSLNKNGLSNIVERLDGSDKRWWSQAETDRHLAMMSGLHRERVEKLKNKAEISYRTFYRRRRVGMQRAEVRNDDLSGCLRTAVGGSGKQFLLEIGAGTLKCGQ